MKSGSEQSLQMSKKKTPSHPQMVCCEGVPIKMIVVTLYFWAAQKNPLWLKCFRVLSFTVQSHKAQRFCGPEETSAIFPLHLLPLCFSCFSEICTFMQLTYQSSSMNERKHHSPLKSTAVNL